MKIATKRDKVWQLEKRIATALRTCLGDGQDRHALPVIDVTEAWLVTTNGKQLLAIQQAHGIKPGRYRLGTDDSLVLDHTGIVFPNWRGLLDGMGPLKKLAVYEDLEMPEQVAHLVWRVNKDAKLAVRLDLLLPAVAALAAFDMPVRLYVREKNGVDGPLMLKGSLGAGTEFTYLQASVRTT